MTSQNPYAAPRANIGDAPQEGPELAGRGQRFGAAIIDGLLGLLWGVPIMIALGTYEYLKAGQAIPWGLTLAGAAIGFVVFVAVQGWFLKTNGQTIGKKIVGIRIADLENNVPRFGKVLGLRYLPVSAVTVVPLVGQFLPLLDVLFIFRSDRRCLHDLIAGTRVVKAG